MVGTSKEGMTFIASFLSIFWMVVVGLLVLSYLKDKFE
jgi:hypothetical protein